MRKFVMTAMAIAVAASITGVSATESDWLTDQNTDQVTDRATDRAADRASDRATDRATDRRNDRANDRARDHLHGLRQLVNRIFNALDLNEDEIITLDEFLVNSAEKAAGQFDHIDADDDELISLEEFLAVHDGDDDRRDIDRDAVRACVSDILQSDESDAMFRETRDRDPSDRQTRFELIDTNGDGFIDIDEFLAAKLEGATHRFNNVDADGDVGITKLELFQALVHHRERRAVRRACVEEQVEIEELFGG